ncbi:MAG: DNA adenine methylase [Deltaproteobacteria bacterium]|nr:DNA adenine methylase [Deltaproteobacteria bacterium]
MGLFRYPGGKTNLAKKFICPRIDELMNRSGCGGFCEPFIGGASVTLTLLEDFSNSKLKVMIGNDKDFPMATLLNVVTLFPLNLIDKIKEFKPSVEDYYYFQGILRSDYHIERVFKEDWVKLAFSKLVIQELSFSGIGAVEGAPVGGLYQIDFAGKRKKHNILVNGTQIG